MSGDEGTYKPGPIDAEKKASEINRVVKIGNLDLNYCYEVVEKLPETFDLTPDEFTLEVNQLNDGEIDGRAIDIFEEVYFPAYYDAREEDSLKSKYIISLGENGGPPNLEVYNFLNDSLEQEYLDEIALTLSKIYQSLKDKSLFNVKSIQILSKDKTNQKNGELIRGREHPKSNSLFLYPSCLSTEKYRQQLNCSELEGTLVHELTHILLENILRDLWKEQANILGWDQVDDGLAITLPGGQETKRFNKNYADLPTEYASYSEEDDRAESTVAYLLDQSKLDNDRKMILEKVLDANIEDRKPKIEKVDTKLPSPPNIKIYVLEDDEAFNMISSSNSENPTERKVSLDEYRRIKDFSNISDLLISLNKNSKNPAELIPLQLEFEEIYKKLPEIADALIKFYRKVLSKYNLDPGKIKLYMTGGRIKGKPLKEDSDIDLIFTVEKPTQSAEGTGSVSGIDPVVLAEMKTNIKKFILEFIKGICLKNEITNKFHILNYGSGNKEPNLGEALLIGSE